MELAVGEEGAVPPVQIYISYEVAVDTLPQLNNAVVCEAMIDPSAGKLLTAQAGAAMAPVVNVDLFDTSQFAAVPPVFLGTIYHEYCVAGARPDVLKLVTVTFVVGEAGGVAPVHR